MSNKKLWLITGAGRGCAPLVTMMKTANFGDRDDVSGGRSTGRSVIWRVLLETEVRPTPMVVPSVGRQDAPEMRLVEDDHVIAARSSDRADQSLDGFCQGLAGAETTSAMPLPQRRTYLSGVAPDPLSAISDSHVDAADGSGAGDAVHALVLPSFARRVCGGDHRGVPALLCLQ
jgi:hypothetical protein